MSGIEKEEHELEPLKKLAVAETSNGDTISSERRTKEDAKAWYHVNRRLLSVKLIYFTFISGMGSLIPFIPLYMKQLGLSTTETGLLIGVMPFIAFFVQPLFGAIADKTRKPKVVLILCLICSGMFFGLLLLPGKFRDESCALSHSIRFECRGEDIVAYSEQCLLNNISQINTINMFEKLINNEKFQSSCTSLCNQYEYHFVNFSTCTHENSAMQMCDVVEGRNITTKNLVSYNTKDMSKCQIHHLEKASRFWNITCKSGFYNICSMKCDDTCPSVSNSKSFWIFSGIYLCANIFFAPILSLIDAMAYNIFGDKRHLWGRQRLWGTFGFAVFSMTTTTIRDLTKQEDGTVDYSISFYMYGSLCLVSALVVTILDVPETFHCHRMLSNVTTLLRIPKVIGFCLVVTCLGVMQSVWLGFLFWYLEDMGSKQIIIGLCCVTTAFSEIVILSISGKIIQLIGHLPCLYISLLAYGVRHLSYSFLTNAWFVLPIELLHGVCLGLMYAAASAYASIISPEGMAATMQGLIAGLYFGFGRGLGFFLTGKLFDPVSGLGGRWTFRFYSLLSFFTLVVYASTNFIVSKYSRRRNKRHVQDHEKEQQAEPYIPPPDEPFLDNKV